MIENAFTADQQEAFKSLIAGKNVFLTGEAGTGKTYVLDAFLQAAHEAGKEVLAMAPTGIAALNLTDGSTIHRSLGLKIEPLDPGEPLGFPREVLKTADIVVIDEISMCRIDLFERVARMLVAAQRATSNKQFVVVGDFFQLPPVITANDEAILQAWYPGNFDGYCFRSAYWKGFEFEAHVLHEVIRQSDVEYIDALNAARDGDEACIEFFNQHKLSKKEKADKDAIWLCSTNKKADKINAARLAEIKERATKYIANETGILNNGDKPTTNELVLKPGARVMALVNEPSGLYQNGSLGTVQECYRNCVSVRFDNGKTAELKPHRWEVKKSIVVNGKDEHGNNKASLESEVIGTFTQIPLRLAYAITIHKSQGQTYPKTIVDTKVFAAGQLYVGLSRCSNPEGLSIFPKLENKALKVRQEVKEFYQSLEQEQRTDEEVPMTTVLCPVCLAEEVEEYIKQRLEQAIERTE